MLWDTLELSSQKTISQIIPCLTRLQPLTDLLPASMVVLFPRFLFKLGHIHLMSTFVFSIRRGTETNPKLRRSQSRRVWFWRVRFRRVRFWRVWFRRVWFKRVWFPRVRFRRTSHHLTNHTLLDKAATLIDLLPASMVVLFPRFLFKLGHIHLMVNFCLFYFEGELKPIPNFFPYFFIYGQKLVG